MTDSVMGTGATYDHGTYRTGERISGYAARGRYGGQRVTDGAHVLITVRVHSWRPELIESLRFRAPGVADLLYLGAPDGYAAPPRTVPTRLAAVIEERPPGTAISQLSAPLGLEDVVKLGLGLVATVAEASEQGVELRGVRPETVYVADGPAGLQVTGVAPRAVRVLGYNNDPPYGSPFDGHSYEAPEIYETAEPSETSDLFSAALTLWFAFTRAHPYRVRPETFDAGVMLADERGSFPGPPELARILEAVLVADPSRRPSIRAVLDELGLLVSR